jgi:cobalt-precorrin-5B (C1)-methyltransferase
MKNMNKLRTGFTTGTCAAAAAKAAVIMLADGHAPNEVEVGLPDGFRVKIPLVYVKREGDRAEAAVIKNAGDDPDVTHGVTVVASISWSSPGYIRFKAGVGVGTVTKPGLSIHPGEPAINSVPRQMIRAAVSEVTERGLEVTVSIPGGKELAKKTFNPRLGVMGGLSILGTTGIVRPYSSPALRAALKCALKVAVACRIKGPVFVPGRIGERSARRHFRLTPEQVIEVSNEWGFMLDLAGECDFEGLLVLGHPGKLAKLIIGEWNTHSSRSKSAVPFVKNFGQKILGITIVEGRTVEGLFASIQNEERSALAGELAAKVREAVFDRVGRKFEVAVVLINIHQEILGHSGDLSSWL